MNDIYTMRTELANDFAVAGAKLLTFTATAGALAAIPNTEPQQYVVAGTLDSIKRILPADEPSHPQRRQRHGQRPTEPLSFNDATAPAASPVAPEQDQAISEATATASGDERAAFEAHEPSSNYERAGDYYTNPCVQSAWEGWQARAAVSAAHIASKPNADTTVVSEIPLAGGWKLLREERGDETHGWLLYDYTGNSAVGKLVRGLNRYESEFIDSTIKACLAATPAASAPTVPGNLYDCTLTHCVTGDVRQALMLCVEEDDCTWRTADDHSELSNGWEVSAWSLAPSASADAVLEAAQHVMREALDETSVHPCDQRNDDARARQLSPLMQNLYRALKATQAAGAEGAE